MARLMEAVTFHVGFDDQTMAPDMAEGPEYAPTPYGTWDNRSPGPQFADGLLGKALVLGTGGAIYPRKGNVLLAKRGAVALWVCPQDWQRPKDGNCVFAMTTNSSFYLQRQGPDQDADGRIVRQEAVHYLVFLPGKRSAGIDAGPAWQNGRWYLLVANWSWPTLELSVNGEPFQVTSLEGLPEEKTFGDLAIGDRSGNRRGLLDEFLAFRRPLTAAEAKLLFETVRGEGKGARD